MTTLVLAADSTGGAGTGPLILLAALVLTVYGIGCAIWPFRACRRCHGAGRFPSPSGKAWRYCRKCSGRGARLRTGRRIWNHLKSTRDHGRNR